jgi:hypothetical protein
LLRKTEFEADFRIVLPDGTSKNIRSIGHPILDERGDVMEFVGASIDLVLREHVDQALQDFLRAQTGVLLRRSYLKKM